ncbi:hypothetical protein CHS0354_020622 [Potamilus streckersoni]|uniref:Uncharacterized protein n=1 Tax=Potamilus streckersoni TaxID=2493646 RepID=A0AAE0SQZ5_9BIVA|nr:hypothetical protein CHS0354_020622 [Potamilus streckersoni]
MFSYTSKPDADKAVILSICQFIDDALNIKLLSNEEKAYRGQLVLFRKNGAPTGHKTIDLIPNGEITHQGCNGMQVRGMRRTRLEEMRRQRGNSCDSTISGK